MRRVLVSAPAKVNLALRVGGVREDGYHELDTVFEAVDLYDDIAVTEASDITVKNTGMGKHLPTDERNLAMKAALLLKEKFGAESGDPAYGRGAFISIHKRIPIAGGMAGGSADAAGTLVALNELWQLGLSRNQLLELGAELGADVPFAIFGGVAHGTGRGEKLSPVRCESIHSWVIIAHSEGIATPDSFGEFDRLHPDAGAPADTEDLRHALSCPQLHKLGPLLINDLEEPARSLRPDIASLLDYLKRAGSGVVLSGSGPTIAVLADQQSAPEIAADLRSDFPTYTITIAHGPVQGAHIRTDAH